MTSKVDVLHKIYIPLSAFALCVCVRACVRACVLACVVSSTVRY